MKLRFFLSFFLWFGTDQGVCHYVLLALSFRNIQTIYYSALKASFPF